MIFRPLVRPTALLRRSPASRTSTAEFAPRPSSQFTTPRSSPQPSPEPKRRPGAAIITTFLVISLPISTLNLFPNSFLPGVPDPPRLAPYSQECLRPTFILKRPIIATELFIFRLRRGVYHSAIRNNWAYFPANFIFSNESTRWWTWTTYMFNHGSVIHYAFCLMALQSIIPLICTRYGTGRAAAFLLISGTGAAALENFYLSLKHQQVLHKARHDPTTALLTKGKQVVIDPKTGEKMERLFVAPKPEFKSVFSHHLGSSSALMAGLMVTAITMPWTRWRFMFIPMDIPARVIMAALVGWDVAGAMGFSIGLGIGHEGHLMGDVMGVLLYALWLRKIPFVGDKRMLL